MSHLLAHHHGGGWCKATRKTCLVGSHSRQSRLGQSFTGLGFHVNKTMVLWKVPWIGEDDLKWSTEFLLQFLIAGTFKKMFKVLKQRKHFRSWYIIINKLGTYTEEGDLEKLQQLNTTSQWKFEKRSYQWTLNCNDASCSHYIWGWGLLCRYSIGKPLSICTTLVFSLPYLRWAAGRIHSPWVFGAESRPDRLALSECTTCSHFQRLNLIGLFHHLSRIFFFFFYLTVTQAARLISLDSPPP